MARKSAASLAVVSAAGPLARLAPTAGLSQTERSLWLEVVNSKPAEWFGAEHAPLLLQYVKHAVNSRLVQSQLAEFDPAWLADEDGMKRYDRLLAMHDREGRAMTNLATKMRLTQQAQYNAQSASTAARSTGQRKPWQTLDESSED